MTSGMYDWPEQLLLVRHAESAGNVARTRALEAGLHTIELGVSRDSDVPLSPLGRRQARALGEWLRSERGRPDAILSSPYLRALETATLVRDAAGWRDLPIAQDERLREKEFGELDRLTRVGIEQKFPREALMRQALGKFYYRPPGGESWTDVILRLRGVAQSLRMDYCGKRVLIVSHQVVVLCLRYIFESLNEKEILAIDAQGDIANCSLTAYRRTPGGGLELEVYNAEAPVAQAGEKVTHEPSRTHGQ